MAQLEDMYHDVVAMYEDYQMMQEYDLWVLHMELRSKEVLNIDCPECKTKTMDIISIDECKCINCQTIIKY